MRIPWKYILVSFLVGLLFGSAIGLYHARDLARHWRKKGPELFLKHLDHELHLTDEQHTKIQTLLNTNRDKMTAYENDLRQNGRAAIRVLLDPAQQNRFDAMVALHDAKRKKDEK
jgi:hypothetical protein